MATYYVITVLTLISLILTSSPCEAWKKDIKVKYYSTVVLTCQENRTLNTDTSTVFWITPDATLLRETTPKGDFPQHVSFVNGSIVSMLNVTYVNDDLFGYYTCVTVKPNSEVHLARWGLNVDGADFSELEEQYRKNAIIGAIAAAVMIVLLGGACLIWHFRYSKRALNHQGGEEVDHELKKKTSSSGNVYQNRAFEESMPRTEAGNGASKNAGGPATEVASQENGGAESYKM